MNLKEPEKMVQCCRCDRIVPEYNTKIDEHLSKPTCKLCRLKLEMVSSPCACFGVNVNTGETFKCKLLWDEKASKVLTETDTGDIIWHR